MDFQENIFLPVILGGDINAYSIARSFYEAYRLPSILLPTSLNNPIASSSFFIERYADEKMGDYPVMLSYLKKLADRHPDKKLLVFGCGDWYIKLLTQHKEELPGNYVLPYPPYELIESTVPKNRFYACCEKLGIPYPRTFIYSMEERPDLPDLSFPLVVKPANSATYFYADFPGKRKVFFFKEREELDQMLTHIHQSSYKDELIFQEYIPGGDSAAFSIHIYCNQEGELRFLSMAQSALNLHTPTGVGNYCCLVNTVKPELSEPIKAFVQGVHYRGVANFDVKYDERDGLYKFFEINTRQGYANYNVTGSGFNLMKVIADDLILGKPQPFTLADRDHLFSYVPTHVLKKYGEPSEVKERALQLKAEGKWSNPLFSPDEESGRMKVYARLAYLNQIRKFHRYSQDV